jgi:translation initiation factor 2 subunit 1
MLLKKEGFPEEGELLLCTVTKIFGHSIFASLDEFNNKQGMINISEVSPGRIRNLRDFVVEGKKIVCLVLRVNKENGHIDLSLRRVNENQKRKKNESIQIETKAEKILESVAKELHLDIVSFYKDLMAKISKDYSTLNACFTDIVNNNLKLKNYGVREDLANKITEVVKERIKPPKITISGNIAVKILASNGIEVIKDAFKKAEDIGKTSVDIKYLGGGSFNMVVTAPDYKKGEKILKEVLDEITKTVEASKGTVSFKRKDDKK